MHLSHLPEKNSATLRDSECPLMFGSRPAVIARSTSGTQATEEENNARTPSELARHQTRSNNRPGSADESDVGADRHHPDLHRAGLILFALAFWIMAKVSPFSIRKEIEEDQNMALGIVIAAVIIGIALIVSAAIHG
jgi:hypothetical protein